MEQVHEFTCSNLKLSSKHIKGRYNVATEGSPLQKGDPVWLFNPQRKKGLSPKLTRSWQGPYLVTKKINDLVYRVQLGPKTKPKVVHRNRLWTYRGSFPPTWLKKNPTPSSEDLDSENVSRAITVPSSQKIGMQASGTRQVVLQHHGVFMGCAEQERGVMLRERALSISETVIHVMLLSHCVQKAIFLRA